jgi:putative ABC transport system permease protein
VTIIAIFLYGFITLITLIGVTNIFNTITTNIYLRKRELAMLRSIGMTEQGFNKMLNFECLFYGLKALLYAIPVSLLINYLMYINFIKVMPIPFTIPYIPILISVIGVFSIVFITMIYAGSKVKKDNILETIKRENI